MTKEQLHFKHVNQVMGSDSLGIIILLNEEETRQLSIPIDEMMLQQFGLRVDPNVDTERMLPEVLTAIIKEQGDRYEIQFQNIVNGAYQVYLVNQDTLDMKPIRASDAVLLALMADIPLYIDHELMRNQSSAYDKKSQGVQLPINTLNEEFLEKALQKSIEEENYEAAAALKEELEKRRKK